MEAKILAACIESREAFKRVSAHMHVTDFTPLGQFWWPMILEWYRDGAAPGVDKDILRERGKRRAGESKHRDTFLEYFDALPRAPSPENVVTEVLEVKRFQKGNELAAAIAQQLEVSKLRTLLRDYDELLLASDLTKSTRRRAPGLDELGAVMDPANKVPLHPQQLNDCVDGGVYPGTMLLFFGRVGIGKTLLTIHTAANMLRQGKRVLYVGNEDRIEAISDRILCNLACMTPDQVEEFRDTANERARRKGMEDRLFLYHLFPGTPDEIEELVVEHEPDVLVVDQIRNIAGGGDGLTQRLGHHGMHFRQMVNRHDLIGIFITQGYPGERGKPIVWHSLDDVESSRTGLPAQADVIVGMGADDEMSNHNTRAIAVCKNHTRNGKMRNFTVQIDPLRSRVI